MANVKLCSLNALYVGKRIKELNECEMSDLRAMLSSISPNIRYEFVDGSYNGELITKVDSEYTVNGTYC